MLFSSTVFIFGFLPVVLFLYYVIFKPIFKNIAFRNILLFFVSIFFYAWGEPKFVLVMILSIIANWMFALLVDRYRDNTKVRFVIILMLVFNLGVIFIFKYLMFFMENVNSLFGTSFLIPIINLPIGISFFTFQSISYVIDVYRKNGSLRRIF